MRSVSILFPLPYCIIQSPQMTEISLYICKPSEQRCGFSSSTKIMQKQGYCKVQGIGLQSTTVLLTSSCPLRRSGSWRLRKHSGAVFRSTFLCDSLSLHRENNSGFGSECRRNLIQSSSCSSSRRSECSPPRVCGGGSALVQDSPLRLCLVFRCLFPSLSTSVLRANRRRIG